MDIKFTSEWNKKNKVKHGENRASGKSRLYSIYEGIKSRCERKANASYNNYGGRGISICKQWRKDFIVFRDWANSHGYAENLEIDRIDNDGNYEPENCRWVTRQQNAGNKPTVKYFSYFGEMLNFSEAERKYGIGRSTIRSRILREGWTPEDAVKVTPKDIHKRNKKCAKGHKYDGFNKAKRAKGGLRQVCNTCRRIAHALKRG